MRAAVTTEAHGFQVVELPDPTPGPDELVIRVAACGVCGSDIKAQPFMPAGFVMGHELGGEIVAVGSDVGNWRFHRKRDVAKFASIAATVGIE